MTEHKKRPDQSSDRGSRQKDYGSGSQDNARKTNNGGRITSDQTPPQRPNKK